MKQEPASPLGIKGLRCHFVYYLEILFVVDACRIMYLMKLGLSEEEIAFMVRTFSPLLGYSIEGVLKPKIEFLVNSMERPVRDVVSYPRYFSYSLEKKIKPRYWVLKRRDIKCSLKDMLGKNDEEFAAEFMGIGRMPVSHPVSSNDSL